MKRIITVIIIFVTGFIGGVYTLLRFISRSGRALHEFKIELIERFEYLLLGYNTIKGPRKSSYCSSYIRRPYSSYRTSYGYYHDNKSFENEDEENKDDNARNN